TAKIWFGFGHESRDHSALSCSRLLRSGIEPRPCGAAAGTRGSGLPGRDARAMARHAGRAAYAIDVSACFPALIVGRVFAVADAQSRGLKHFAPPRHRRRLRRSYRARRLVGQGAAATGGRSAKVAQDAITFLKIRAVRSEQVGLPTEQINQRSIAFPSARAGRLRRPAELRGRLLSASLP